VERNVATATVGKIRVISLDRPAKLNAVTVQMDIDLVRAIAGAEADEEVAVILIRAEGRCFSAGHDLVEVGGIMEDLGADAADWDKVYEKIWPEGSPVHAVFTCSKPVVVAVKGSVVGMMVPFVVSCDIIIAAEGTEFNEEILRTGGGAGLAPYIGLVPANLLSELVYTGRLKAEKLAACGVINELTTGEMLDEVAMRYAQAATLVMPYSAQGFKRAQRAMLDNLGIGNAASMQSGGKDSHGDARDTEFWTMASKRGVRNALEWRDA
jgi:enoyl-CoA hydratase/carnithine racemase